MKGSFFFSKSGFAAMKMKLSCGTIGVLNVCFTRNRKDKVGGDDSNKQMKMGRKG